MCCDGSLPFQLIKLQGPTSKGSHSVVSARLAMLTPITSIRSETRRVILEILPYIRAQFAFKPAMPINFLLLQN